MAVNSNTLQTVASTTIKEDLQDVLNMISPTQFPLMNMAKTRTVTNTLFETPEIELATAVSNNQVVEGEASPGNDAALLPKRIQSTTEIADKVVEVSDSSNNVVGAGRAESMAEQIVLHTKSLKRDMETSLCANKAANLGTASAARVTPGMPAWLKDNTSRGTGGANPTLSSTTHGYPNAAATDATNANLRAISETLLKSVISSCWNAGAEPTTVVVGSANKQAISGFSGSAQLYKDADQGVIQQGMSVYASDFGDLSIVPSRHIRSRDAYVVDPEYITIGYLQTLKQRDLARTGHAERKLMSVEFGLYVMSEANGIIADLS